jgi:hypothetical protein
MYSVINQAVNKWKFYQRKIWRMECSCAVQASVLTHDRDHVSNYKSATYKDRDTGKPVYFLLHALF